jgi:hypothetical protein
MDALPGTSVASAEKVVASVRSNTLKFAQQACGFELWNSRRIRNGYFSRYDSNVHTLSIP